MWIWRLTEQLMLTKWAHKEPFVELLIFLSAVNINRGSIIKEPTEPGGDNVSTDVRHRRMPCAVGISIPHTHTHMHPHASTERKNCCVQLIISVLKDKIFPIVIHWKEIKANTPWLPVICSDVLFIMLELRLHMKNWKNGDCVRTQPFRCLTLSKQAELKIVQLVFKMCLLPVQQEIAKKWTRQCFQHICDKTVLFVSFLIGSIY